MVNEVVIFVIDGLNIDENGFNWKDRLMLTNGKRKTPGIALAAVNSDQRSTQSETVEDAYHFLILFLACYQLVNARNPIPLPGWVSYELKPQQSFTEFVKGQPIPLEYVAHAPNFPEQQTMQEIIRAIPTFEKVMAAVDSGNVAALETALVMYLRSVNTMESIEDFIGMVTVLEALFSDVTELTYKLSLRTALLLKDKMSNSREIFDDVHDIYKKRSGLVHGSIVPKRFRKELIPLKMKAERYAHYALLNYIELVARGMTKEDIIEMLNNKALGFEQCPMTPSYQSIPRS